MKKSDLLAAAVFAVALVLFLILSGAFYTVDQTEQVIITQFGQPVGDPITEPGLHFKTLETYHKIFSKDSTLVLSTDSECLRFSSGCPFGNAAPSA